MELRRFQHGVTDSTSERAFAAIADGGAKHGDVHLAVEQTAGRGRLGRAWVSTAGEGLYLSVVLLPAEPLGPAALTMAAGLAVLDLVRELGARSAGLKWPNDIVVGEAKLAGILVETRGLDERKPHYVVGIGLNVLQREFPAELLAERPVTSLLLQGCHVTLEETEESLIPHLSSRLATITSDPSRLAADFLDACGLAGRNVCARTAETEQTGALVGLSLERGISLRSDDGAIAHMALEFVRELVAC